MEDKRLTSDSFAYAEERRKCDRKFAMLIVGVTTPFFAAVPVLASSGDWNTWYQEGVGWPLRYGWRTLCIHPNAFKITVDRSLAMWTDIFVAAALLFVGAYLIMRIEAPSYLIMRIEAPFKKRSLKI